MGAKREQNPTSRLGFETIDPEPTNRSHITVPICLLVCSDLALQAWPSRPPSSKQSGNEAGKALHGQYNAT
jgi:hypothetical protein